MVADRIGTLRNDDTAILLPRCCMKVKAFCCACCLVMGLAMVCSEKAVLMSVNNMIIGFIFGYFIILISV